MAVGRPRGPASPVGMGPSGVASPVSRFPVPPSLALLPMKGTGTVASLAVSFLCVSPVCSGIPRSGISIRAVDE